MKSYVLFTSKVKSTCWVHLNTVFKFQVYQFLEFISPLYYCKIEKYCLNNLFIIVLLGQYSSDLVYDDTDVNPSFYRWCTSFTVVQCYAFKKAWECRSYIRKRFALAENEPLPTTQIPGSGLFIIVSGQRYVPVIHKMYWSVINRFWI